MIFPSNFQNTSEHNCCSLAFCPQSYNLGLGSKTQIWPYLTMGTQIPMTYENGLTNPSYRKTTHVSITAPPSPAPVALSPSVSPVRRGAEKQPGDPAKRRPNHGPRSRVRTGPGGTKPCGRKAARKILATRDRDFNGFHPVQSELRIPSSTRTELTDIEPLCPDEAIKLIGG